MKKFAIVAAATLLAAATTTAYAADKASAAKAINEAVQATLDAAKVKGEWRDTFKTIGKAKEAYKKGDYEGAEKMAMKAKHQGEMGMHQAMGQAHADIPAGVK